MSAEQSVLIEGPPFADFISKGWEVVSGALSGPKDGPEFILLDHQTIDETIVCSRALSRIDLPNGVSMAHDRLHGTFSCRMHHWDRPSNIAIQINRLWLQQQFSVESSIDRDI
jgi:hypothetical protein